MAAAGLCNWVCACNGKRYPSGAYQLQLVILSPSDKPASRSYGWAKDFNVVKIQCVLAEIAQRTTHCSQGAQFSSLTCQQLPAISSLPRSMDTASTDKCSAWFSGSQILSL